MYKKKKDNVQPITFKGMQEYSVMPKSNVKVCFKRLVSLRKV